MQALSLPDLAAHLDVGHAMMGEDPEGVAQVIAETLP